jgi:uroporphyrinogen-III synthase
VEYAACYRRGKPALDVAALERDAHTGRIGVVIFTSSEGVRNFCEALSESGDSGIDWLRKTPVVVPHPRIADAASKWGLRHVVVSAPGEEALLLSLIGCFETHPKKTN